MNGIGEATRKSKPAVCLNQPSRWETDGIKARQSDRAPSLAILWQSAQGNPVKYSPSRVQPPRRICSLNRLFPPIPPGSNELACGKGGFSGQRFDDVWVAQAVTESRSIRQQNPIYVLFCSCLLEGSGLKEPHHSRNHHDKITRGGWRMARKKRILIVEDEVPLACWMVSVLTHAGCDVETARSGKRAMELASECKFDLITLDIKLPDTNGFEICSELKQRHISRRTPIIFISASSSEEDLRQSFRLGAKDYMTKPLEATDLIYRVVLHANNGRQHSAAWPLEGKI